VSKQTPTAKDASPYPYLIVLQIFSLDKWIRNSTALKNNLNLFGGNLYE